MTGRRKPPVDAFVLADGVVIPVRANAWSRWCTKSHVHPSRRRTLLADGSHGVQGLKHEDLWDVVAADGSHFVLEQVTTKQMDRYAETVGYR